MQNCQYMYSSLSTRIGSNNDKYLNSFTFKICNVHFELMIFLVVLQGHSSQGSGPEAWIVFPKNKQSLSDQDGGGGGGRQSVRSFTARPVNFAGERAKIGPNK